MSKRDFSVTGCRLVKTGYLPATKRRRIWQHGGCRFCTGHTGHTAPPPLGIWTLQRPHRPHWATVRNFLPGGTSPLGRAVYGVKDQSRTVMLPPSKVTGSPLATVGDDSIATCLRATGSDLRW